MSSRSRKNRKKGGQSKTPIFIGLAALVVIVAGAVWLIAGSAGGHKSDITVAEAVALRDQGALFVDVRTTEEYSAAHVAGSVSIPLDQLQTRINEVPRDREVVVICASGTRAKTGRDMLVEAGYTKVACMTGGLHEWQAEGYPTVAGP